MCDSAPNSKPFLSHEFSIPSSVQIWQMAIASQLKGHSQEDGS